MVQILVLSDTDSQTTMIKTFKKQRAEMENSARGLEAVKTIMRWKLWN